jgi:alpha-mannosidase
MPGTFQAWDIEEHYTDIEFPVNDDVGVEVLEQGPVQASLLVSRRFGNSRMTQRIVLGASARRLDFETWVDWKEQHKLLKVRFHTTIRSRRATYDIAYGNIERPTTKNNSFEKAKFEVPGHEWMDLSQADHGLSLLTDCKYGYQAHDQMIALTLLKGPKYPDPVSDQEEHWFTYSLYPHERSWREAATIQEAVDLNDPVLAVLGESHSGALPSAHSFVFLEGSGLTLEAVKQAETNDDLIVRVVERLGGRTQAALRVACPIETCFACDLMESGSEPLRLEQGVLQFEMGPYEVCTFRLGKQTTPSLLGQFGNNDSRS